jgi:hypothetical protein
MSEFNKGCQMAEFGTKAEIRPSRQPLKQRDIHIDPIP